MSYDVDFERGSHWLRACVRGDGRDFAAAIHAWRRIAAAVVADRPPALLVVSELRGEPFTVEQAEAFVRDLHGLGFEALRVAYVYSQLSGWDIVETAQIHAMEAGYEARAFTDEPTARTWLRHGER